jgi:hypothetical protein
MSLITTSRRFISTSDVESKVTTVRMVFIVTQMINVVDNAVKIIIILRATLCCINEEITAL